MTTYTWQFPALDVYPSYEGLTNAVYAMNWRLTGDDGAGHTAEIYGEQPAGPIDPLAFIPYASLTEADVQGWLETEMGTSLIAELKAGLDAGIASQISPASVSLAPPWV